MVKTRTNNNKTKGGVSFALIAAFKAKSPPKKFFPKSYRKDGSPIYIESSTQSGKSFRKLYVNMGDIEDMAYVLKKKDYNKLYNWLKVFPAIMILNEHMDKLPMPSVKTQKGKSAFA